MANPYIREGFMPGEWDTPEAPRIMRRQKMAEQLLQQANEPLQAQMVSGHYVAPSWTQYLAKGLQQYSGRKELRDIEKEQKDLITQRQQAIAEALKTPQAQQVNEGQPVTTSTMPAYTPEQQDRFGSPLPDVQRQAVTTTTQPTRTETPDELQNRQRQMLYQAVAKYGADPSVQLALGDLNFQREAGLKEKDLAEARAFRSQEAELARQQRMQEIALRLQDAQLGREQNAALRREMAQLAAANRQQAQPYFTAVPTAQGYARFNARTGQMEPISIGGGTVLPAAQDPTLQGRLAGAKESGKLTGEAQTKASINLPQTISQAQDAVKLVDDLLSSPGMKQAVGTSRMLGLQKIPGTAAKDFDVRLDQLKGKQFLQAFETLKGGGQITEIEGKKATDAISRMNPDSSEEEFTKASREFQDIIRKGAQRAANIARGAQIPAQMPNDIGAPPPGAVRRK